MSLKHRRNFCQSRIRLGSINSSVRLKHVCFRGELDLIFKTLTGVAHLDFLNSDMELPCIVLDAVGFVIKRVLVNGLDSAYKYDGVRLTVATATPAKSIRVSVEYSVQNPNAGIHFVPSFAGGTFKQAWTQGECRGTRFWLPIVDAPNVKCTSEIIMTVDSSYMVISNGLLKRIESSANTKTYYWLMDRPHSPYLICFVVGMFESDVSKCDGVELSYYVPTGRKGDIERSFAKTCDMIRFFSQWLEVPYPYSSYSQCCVAEFSYAGMENTSCTVLSEHTLHDSIAHEDFSSEDPDFYSDDVVSHELAHQWFGDLVTCKVWDEVWLHEAFATLLQALYFRWDKGKEEFYYNMILKLDRYFEETSSRHSRSIVANSYAVPEELLDRHSNEKGALVLNSLMNQIGEKKFRKAIGLYLKRFQYDCATTLELEECFEEVTGLNLKWFFKQWIRRAGHPSVEVYWDYDNFNKKINIRLEQVIAQGDAYKLPVNIRVRLHERYLTEQVILKKRVETFAFETHSKPLYVCVDPEISIVGILRIHEKEQSLLTKALKDDHLYCRVLAIRELAHFKSGDTVKTLSRLLSGNQFWAISSEAATSLAKIGSAPAKRILLDAINHRDPRVRRSVVLALSAFKAKRVFRVLKETLERDQSYYVKAAAASGLGRMGGRRAFHELLSVLSVPSQNDVVARNAINGLVDAFKEEALKIILEQTRIGVHDLRRRAATLALAAYGNSSSARLRIKQLMKDPDFAVRMSAVEAAKRSGWKGFIKDLEKIAESDIEGMVVGSALDALEILVNGRVRVIN
jgi:aminopeptidase N